jgi:prevent-host-death family protein
MSTISIRDLTHQASRVVDSVQRTGRPAIVTKHGRPVAALVPIDSEALEDWVLSQAPEFVENMRQADEEIARGERGVPLDQVLTEFGQADE